MRKKKLLKGAIVSALLLQLHNHAWAVTIDDIIKNIGDLSSGLDGLFSTDNTHAINAQINNYSRISGCFGASLPSLSDFSGLCQNLPNLGLGGLGDTASVLSCMGMDVSSLGNLSIDFSGLCAGTNVERFISSGGSSTEWGLGDYGTSTSVHFPSGVGYKNSSTTIIATADLDAISDGTTKNKPKKPEEIKYSGGKNGKEVANHFAEEYRTNPTSSTAMSWKKFDKSSLFLKEYSLKLVGSDNESLLKLPATKAESIEDDTMIAALAVSTAVNHEWAKDMLAQKAIATYSSISANTVEEYKQKEFAKFESEIRTSEEVSELYMREQKFVDMKYAPQETLEKADPNYMFDPSEERAKELAPEQRNDYLFLALQHKAKMVKKNIEIGMEKKIRKEMIDITIKRAYYASSVFPTGVAEQEINQLLEAVDTAIK